MIIYVANQSKRVSDADVQAMATACDSQLYFHAAPSYGYKPNRVLYTATPASVGAQDALIIVTDTPDQADALGWHSEQASGQSYGYVFAAPVLDNGGATLTGRLSLSSVLSHEVLETSCNPGVNVSADDGAGWLWDYEVADPVEGYSYAITSKRVMVSDFVLPAFFNQASVPGVKYDWMGQLSKPFEVAPGGYASRQPSGTRTQIQGAERIPALNDSRVYPTPAGMQGPRA